MPENWDDDREPESWFVVLCMVIIVLIGALFVFASNLPDPRHLPAAPVIEQRKVIADARIIRSSTLT